MENKETHMEFKKNDRVKNSQDTDPDEIAQKTMSRIDKFNIWIF